VNHVYQLYLSLLHQRLTREGKETEGEEKQKNITSCIVTVVCQMDCQH